MSFGALSPHSKTPVTQENPESAQPEEPTKLTHSEMDDPIGEAISKEVFKETGHSLNLFTTKPPATINSVATGTMKWVKIATIVDSGACKHVTPKGIFSLITTQTEASKSGHMFYGADGKPIANLGQQTMVGTSEEGQQIILPFEVAPITRPLASVAEIVSKKHRVVFDKECSYVEDKASGRWVELRQEGNLYFLDLWTQVPEELSTNPFVRQTA